MRYCIRYFICIGRGDESWTAFCGPAAAAIGLLWAERLIKSARRLSTWHYTYGGGGEHLSITVLSPRALHGTGLFTKIYAGPTSRSSPRSGRCITAQGPGQLLTFCWAQLVWGHLGGVTMVCTTGDNYYNYYCKFLLVTCARKHTYKSWLCGGVGDKKTSTTGCLIVKQLRNHFSCFVIFNI